MEIDARLERSAALLPEGIDENIDALFAQPPNDAFFILDIAVHPAAQDMGLGARLIDHAEHRARRAGALSLCPDVNEANPATGFYKRQGFRPVSRSDVPALHPFGVGAHVHMRRAIPR